MPRHPPNALTSRLRVHTTNDKPEGVPSVVRMIVFISASINQCVDRHDPIERRTVLSAVNRTSAASIEKPIHNVKVPMGKVETLPKSARRRKLLSSYLDTTGGAYRDRTDDPLLAKQVLSQLS